MNLLRGAKLKALTLAMATASMLAGCGGGGDEGVGGTSGTGDQVPEGAYAGSISGSSTSSAFQMLILDNGTYWSMYGNLSGGRFLVRGFIQGTGSFSGGSFTSSDARDYGFSPAVSGAVNATYTTGTSVQGTVSAGGQSASFSGSPITSTTYDYATPASISAVQGNWTLTSLTGASASLTIAASGSLSGSSQGCAFTGSMTPRASGKNVFDVAITFGASPCAQPGQSGTGIAVTNLLAGTQTRQLIFAGVNAARSQGTALFGTR